MARPPYAGDQKNGRPIAEGETPPQCWGGTMGLRDWPCALDTAAKHLTE